MPSGTILPLCLLPQAANISFLCAETCKEADFLAEAGRVHDESVEPSEEHEALRETEPLEDLGKLYLGDFPAGLRGDLH
eukprot:Gb_31464 [translate_table: standard]